jgi:hypothetical protein
MCYRARTLGRLALPGSCWQWQQGMAEARGQQSLRCRAKQGMQSARMQLSVRAKLKSDLNFADRLKTAEMPLLTVLEKESVEDAHPCLQ